MRTLLRAAVLISLGAAACTNSPGTTGSPGGSGGGTGGSAGSGGAGGSTIDAPGADTPVTVGSGGAGSGGAGGGAAPDTAGDRGNSGSADGGGDTGGLVGKGRTGMKSAGCSKTPMGATAMSFTNHRIAIPACASCTIPNCPKNCIAPPFAPGGRDAQMTANGETFIDRDFTIQVPAGYDPNHPYPVFYGGNGCGHEPPLTGVGFAVPGEDSAIKIGLQMVSLASNALCFADGGIRCTPDIKNVADCVNGPEIPYFLAVQDWVEANFCVDLGAEFSGGSSSGAWESLLITCASASTMRGVYTLAGGLREHRWPCDGPTAAFMVASDRDTGNPVGPLPNLNVIEDTYGSAPARDELLTRNGCVGKATAPYDPKYPFCMKYTGCPAAYPVVWCEFPGGNHADPNYNGVNYANAIVPFLLGLPAP
ncbi:MAG: polyhydroxybutyrate depolymerase [Myxococcales bacterium]|nr:polyhydroxybutyrate depolymerase [Myxococcales bacterium]